MKNRIRELRQQMNLTQQELAIKSKIGYRTISDYERGEKLRTIGITLLIISFILVFLSPLIHPLYLR